MSNLQSFNCPTCAAPIVVSGDQAEIRCEFCGNMIIVPPELRTQQPLLRGIEPIDFTALDPKFAQAMRAVSQKQSAGSGVNAFSYIFLLLFVGVVGGVLLYLGAASNGKKSVTATATPGPTLLTEATRIPPTIAMPPTTIPATPVMPPPTIFSFGGKGAGDGLFAQAGLIALDNGGNQGIAYVSDQENGRIQRFDHDGRFTNGWQIDPNTGAVNCLATDQNGHVYACQGNTIYKYTGNSGAFVQKISGTGSDRFVALAVRTDGSLVAYSTDRDQLLFIGANGKVSKRIAAITFAHNGSTGSSPQGDYSLKMALNSQGKIFLLNVEKSFVLTYGPDGQYQSRWGGEGGQPENFFLAPDGIRGRRP